MASNESAVQVSGLAPSVTDAALMNIFRSYGPVARIKRDKFNGAHVVFKSKRSAKKAAEATAGAVVEGQPIAVRLVAAFKSSNNPCRGFQAGICKKGDACKYLHVGGDDVKPAVTAPPKVKAKTATKATATPVAKPTNVIATDVSGIDTRVVCRHFSRGNCSLGATCKFAHVVGAPDVTATLTKTKPCAFFASGACTRGDQCTYLHEIPVAADSKKEKKAKEPNVKPKPTVKSVANNANPVKPRVAKQLQQVESESESEEDEEMEKEQRDTRTCVECEQEGAARWVCANCDGALYCDECDAAAHRAKVMSKHKRSLLPPPVTKKPKCGECEEASADVECEQCEVVLCAACNASVHRFKSTRSHTRTPISAEATKSPSKIEEVVVKKAETKTVQTVKKQKVEQPLVEKKPAPVSSFDAKVAARQFVESVPKYDISSESESESEAESDSESDSEAQSTPTVTRTPAEPAATVVKQVSTPALDISSESSDEESDEVEKKAPVPAKASPAQTAESESSESDFDDVKPASPATTAVKVKATPVAAAVTSSSSSSSESSESSESEEETPARPAPVRAAPAPQQQSKKPLPPTNRKPGISDGSSHTLVKKIEAYAESDETEVLHLDPNLNGFERLLAHDCAERLGLQHVSVGSGLERHITISKSASQPEVGAKRRR